MTDREKVVNGLECCLALEDDYCDNCPYSLNEWECDKLQLKEDALALLKAQEPIEARLNLCESCTKEFPECEATIDDIEFGSGVGDDNIIGCAEYVNRWKAQEPRVMTLEEVKMLDSDYYYLESMRSPGKELREIIGTYGLTCVTWPSITWARQTMGDSGYGKTWRCWTSRPTEAEREAIPWN